MNDHKRIKLLEQGVAQLIEDLHKVQVDHAEQGRDRTSYAVHLLRIDKTVTRAANVAEMAYELLKAADVMNSTRHTSLRKECAEAFDKMTARVGQLASDLDHGLGQENDYRAKGDAALQERFDDLAAQVLKLQSDGPPAPALVRDLRNQFSKLRTDFDGGLAASLAAGRSARVPIKAMRDPKPKPKRKLSDEIITTAASVKRPRKAKR